VITTLQDVRLSEKFSATPPLQFNIANE